MSQKKTLHEDIFLLGMFYSGGYKDEKPDMEFYFENPKTEELFVSILERNEIRYMRIHKGMRDRVKILHMHEVEKFVSKFNLSVNEVSYHNIPNLIYQNKELARYFVLGLIEMCGIRSGDIAKILIDSFHLSAIVEEIVQWANPEVKTEKRVCFLPKNTQGVVLSFAAENIRSLMKGTELEGNLKFS